MKNLFLLVAGKPWGKELGQNISKSLAGIGNKKLMLKHVPHSQIKFLFAASDVVILPYRDFSAQSAVGSTALFFSKPILVSDAGGLPELVLSKETVFEAGNPKDLASKLDLIFTKKGLLQRMVSDSKKLRQKYSWKGICKTTIRLYDSLFP